MQTDETGSGSGESPVETPEMREDRLTIDSAALVSSAKDDQRYDAADFGESNDEEDPIIRHWKESAFAVGLTRPTWADEDMNCSKLCNSCITGSKRCNVHCSGYFCSLLGASRVGNMAVLWKRLESVENESGETVQQPRIVFVVGPYWTVTLCLTLPLFFCFTLWTGFTTLPERDLVIVIGWATSHALFLLSLFNVACRDPGILYRHSEPPDGQESSWRWNDQAMSYRPPRAKYDPECGAIVEDFDHTCPWTGTAIGRRNMPWFRVFLFSLVAALIFDVALLTWI